MKCCLEYQDSAGVSAEIIYNDKHKEVDTIIKKIYSIWNKMQNNIDQNKILVREDLHSLVHFVVISYVSGLGQTSEVIAMGRPGLLPEPRHYRIYTKVLFCFLIADGNIVKSLRLSSTWSWVGNPQMSQQLAYNKRRQNKIQHV